MGDTLEPSPVLPGTVDVGISVIGNLCSVKAVLLGVIYDPAGF